MEKLVIVDGNAILHRAYHALPPLTNKDGKLTNAVYGFGSMILRAVQDLKPKYLVVTFDRPAPTFRKKLFKDYQGKRPEMEDGLSSQIEMVHELITKLNIPIFEMDGYEADDIIGTISREVDGKLEKIIITGDRDIFQLVNKDTKVYMPQMGLSNGKIYGEEEVKEKMGVNPNQIIDLKALTGDPSDNYPGVAGIGPKTATFLLENYNSLQGIYKAIKEQNFTTKIPDKVVLKLTEGYDDALLSQKLATIVTDAPIKFDLQKTKLSEDPNHFGNIFLEFGFESLAKRAGLKTEVKPIKTKEEKKNQDNQLGLF